MTQEYLRAIAGSGLGDGITTVGRIGLMGNLLLVRLHGADGPIQVVHDHRGTPRTEGEVLLVAPTQEAPGLTGYRVVEGAPVPVDAIFTNDAGTIYQITPATLVAASLGAPGITVGALATIARTAFVGGLRTVTNPIRFWQAGVWSTVTDIASSTLDFTRPMVVAANGVGYALVQVVGTNDLTLYRLAPPATTSTLVSSLSLLGSGEFLLVAVAAGAGSDVIFVQTQHASGYALYKWDGLAWSTLTAPSGGGSVAGQLSVYGEDLYWMGGSAANNYRTGRTDGTAWTSITTSIPFPHFIDSELAVATGSFYGAGYNQLAVSEASVPLGIVHYGAGGTTRRSYLRDLTAGTNLVTSDWSNEIHGTPMTGPQAVSVNGVDVLFFAMGNQGGTAGVPPPGVFRWDGASVTTAYTTASGPPQLWRGVAVIS